MKACQGPPMADEGEAIMHEPYEAGRQCGAVMLSHALPWSGSAAPASSVHTDVISKQAQ